MDGSKVLVQSDESPAEAWDFGAAGSTPVQLLKTSSVRLHLDFVLAERPPVISSVKIKDTVTGQYVFQLCGKYANPPVIQWDGRYLIAGYESGEVLILDFSHVLA